MAKPAGKTWSVNEAAPIIGVTRQTLAKWLADGCPAVERADRSRGVEWALSIPAVIDWRIRRAVEDAVSKYEDDGQISTDEAKRRKAIADAVVAEVEAARALNEVVLVADVIDVVSSRLSLVRQRLSGVGAFTAGRAATMTSAPDIQDLVDGKVQEILSELRFDEGEIGRSGSA